MAARVTDRSSPTRWRRSSPPRRRRRTRGGCKTEGLEIISVVLRARTCTRVELKPWARRGGRGVFLNHDASRTSNDCYVCEIPPGRRARAAAPALRGDDLRPRRPRLDRGLERRRDSGSPSSGRRARSSRSRSTPGTSTSTARARTPARFVAVTNAPVDHQRVRRPRLRLQHAARLQRPLQRRARLLRQQGRAEGAAARHELRRRRDQPAAASRPRSAAPAAATSASAWPRAR